MKENIDKVYRSLLEDCSRANAKKSLSIIKSACDSQVERGSADFSYATIAKIVAPDGPAESTIMNKAGHRYRALISVYQNAHGSKLTVKKKVDKDSWVDEIESLEHKWLVRDLIAENKKLRAKANALAAKAGPIHIDLRPNSVHANQGQLPDLNSQEKDTLNQFVSPENLKANGLAFDKGGRLITLSGDKLSGQRFEQIINKLLTVKSS